MYVHTMPMPLPTPFVRRDSRRRGMGDSVIAMPGPTMPENVQAANNAMWGNPILQSDRQAYNLMVGFVNSVLPAADPGQATVLGAGTPIDVNSAIQSYKALPPNNLQAFLGPYLDLWKVMPAWNANASTLDAWDALNNFGGTNNAKAGQVAQQFLQAFFAGIGIDPGSQGVSQSAVFGNLPNWAIPAAIAAIILAVVL